MSHKSPNHALQRNRPSRHGCNPRVPWAGFIILGMFWGAIHILIALGVGYVAHTFMLWHLDDGYAFTLNQWGWIRTAALRALPWQIVGLLIAWGFLAIGRACVGERDGAFRAYLPWAVALSGFAVLSVLLTASGIEFVIRKPYF